MKTTFLLRFATAVSLFLALAGCEAIVTSAMRSSRDWQFVQSVGGMALGTPRRDVGGHVLLPIRCDVSGTQVITVRPTAVSSALVCEPPLVRVRSGTVFLTIRTTLASSRNSSALCPAADLGALAVGRYSVIYRSPGGHKHELGTIQVRAP